MDKDRERSKHELAIIAKVKKIAARLPEVDIVIDGFGHTTFKVAKKPFVMIGGGDDGRGSLSVKADPDTQAALIKRGPWVRTPYIGQHGWVTLMGDVKYDWEQIEDLVTDAFQRVAPARLKRG
jgi:predicted DNA-binding protein (MmcQ/YjbR family)